MTNFDLFNQVTDELAIVEERLISSIKSDLPLLDQASTHLVKAGGKRLRPAFALLSAKMFTESLDEVIPLAVALELIHMATLVHDDVIDNSSLRRGRETVKSGWGNRVSIYAGNYVFARSLSLVSLYQRSDILEVLAEASMRICEGEINQMMSCYDVNQGLKDYLRRIERKTALLISVSCQLGAMLLNVEEYKTRALKNYGYYLGMAFQITDDILDFVADEEILGKPVGSDIKQGVITLPAIYAIKFDPRGDQLRNWLASPEECVNRSEDIIQIVNDSEGIDYAYQVSCRYLEKARQELRFLPDVPVKESFNNIALFISNREF